MYAKSLPFLSNCCCLNKYLSLAPTNRHSFCHPALQCISWCDMCNAAAHSFVHCTMHIVKILVMHSAPLLTSPCKNELIGGSRCVCTECTMFLCNRRSSPCMNCAQCQKGCNAHCTLHTAHCTPHTAHRRTHDPIECLHPSTAPG